VWREGAQRPWPASLQNTAKEEVYHVATIEVLFAFLDARLGNGDGESTVQP
jgi:hypothetical protein